MEWIAPQLQQGQDNSNNNEPRASSVSSTLSMSSSSNGSEVFFVGKKVKKGCIASAAAATAVVVGGGPVGRATRKFRCDHCASKFMSQEMLDLHAENCQRIEGLERKAVRGVKADGSSFACDLCTKICNSPFGLKIHVSRMHPKKNNEKAKKEKQTIFPCSYCDYQTKYPYNIKIHERKHTDERPEVCKYCGEAFRYRATKNVHELKCRSRDGLMSSKNVWDNNERSGGRRQSRGSAPSYSSAATSSLSTATSSSVGRPSRTLSRRSATSTTISSHSQHTVPIMSRARTSARGAVKKATIATHHHTPVSSIPPYVPKNSRRRQKAVIDVDDLPTSSSSIRQRVVEPESDYDDRQQEEVQLEDDEEEDNKELARLAAGGPAAFDGGPGAAVVSHYAGMVINACAQSNIVTFHDVDTARGIIGKITFQFMCNACRGTRGVARCYRGRAYCVMCCGHPDCD